MGRRFLDVTVQNFDLEQDITVLRKKFRELLTQKGGQPEPEGGQVRPQVQVKQV